MHCVLQIQILWISWYTKLLIVVKDLVSVRTALAIHSKKNCPFERLRLPVREKLPSVPTVRPIRSRKIAILSKGSGYALEKIAIRRSNGSGYPFTITSCMSFHGTFSAE